MYVPGMKPLAVKRNILILLVYLILIGFALSAYSMNIAMTTASAFG
ncbi:MAG TPA: hypothetical protein VFJ06_13060 [Halococcus sp.]|nr:hypothetical protein [Halococcus sp.]